MSEITKPSGPACSVCAFVHRVSRGLEAGWECRRYPPAPVMFRSLIMGCWPEVSPLNFCGEFKPKEAEDA